MRPKIDQFLLVLETYFDMMNIPVHQALTVIMAIAILSPLLIRGRLQSLQRGGREGTNGAWFSVASDILRSTTELMGQGDSPFMNPVDDINSEDMYDIARALNSLNPERPEDTLDPTTIRSLFPAPVLVTPHLHCLFCSTTGNPVILKVHRRDKKHVRT